MFELSSNRAHIWDLGSIKPCKGRQNLVHYSRFTPVDGVKIQNTTGSQKILKRCPKIPKPCHVVNASQYRLQNTTRLEHLSPKKSARGLPDLQIFKLLSIPPTHKPTCEYFPHGERKMRNILILFGSWTLHHPLWLTA